MRAVERDSEARIQLVAKRFWALPVARRWYHSVRQFNDGESIYLSAVIF